MRFFNQIIIGLALLSLAGCTSHLKCGPRWEVAPDYMQSWYPQQQVAQRQRDEMAAQRHQENLQVQQGIVEELEVLNKKEFYERSQ